MSLRSEFMSHLLSQEPEEETTADQADGATSEHTGQTEEVVFEHRIF